MEFLQCICHYCGKGCKEPNTNCGRLSEIKFALQECDRVKFLADYFTYQEYHSDIKTIRDALYYACNALEGQLEGCEDEELISQNNKAIELIAKLLKRKKI